MNDFLTLDIPVETGPINFTFLNDEDAAKGYIYQARKFMAFTKQQYGVYERIASGQPGGFHRNSVDLEDGTRITVYTNDGIDTAVIATVNRVKKKKEEKEEEFEHDLDIGKDFYIGVKYVQGGIPLPSKLYGNVSADPDYLVKRFVIPHLCVWVPEKKREGSDERLVVSNRNSILGVDINDPDQFYLGGIITRPHYENEKEFPIGLLVSGHWIVEEGVDRYGSYWDVLITHKAIPPSGNYDVKVCAVTSDCAVISPVEFEVVVSFGFLIQNKRFVISESSADPRLMMPRGFFWESPKGGGKEDWYRNLDTTANPVFGDQTNRIYPNGPNPHGPNWWQGGVTGYFDHTPKLSKNKSSLSVVSEDSNGGKGFLVDGAFEPDAVSDYSDPGSPLNPNDRYFFSGPFSGYPPRNDRCTGFLSSTQKRFWAVLRLGTAGQNVAYTASRKINHECVNSYPGQPASDLGIMVFLNLGSANENDFLADIPGAENGSKVQFFSPASGRTITATAAQLFGSGFFTIGSVGIPCAYATLELTTDVQDFLADRNGLDSVLTDFFFLSVVEDRRDFSHGPPYYEVDSQTTYTVDTSFTMTVLDTFQDSGSPAYEDGPFEGLGTPNGPTTIGWLDALEKHWAKGK